MEIYPSNDEKLSLNQAMVVVLPETGRDQIFRLCHLEIYDLVIFPILLIVINSPKLLEAVYQEILKVK